MEPLTKAERGQLRQLVAVYDNPTITATWRRDECDRLVELGYAQRHEHEGGIRIVSLHPDRVAEARAVLAEVSSTTKEQ